MPWPTKNHESPDIDLVLPTVTAPHYLWALLKADGESFRAQNYALVRANIASAIGLFGQGRGGGQAPSAAVSDQRLRTWKRAFEDMALLTVSDDRIRATRFGKAVIDGWSRVDEALKGANSRIALLGAEVANRIRLAPPGDVPPGVPADSDLLPLRAIWRAFRALDDRLHWQDVNLVLGNVHYEAQLPEAIERIREYRKRHGGAYAPATLSELGSAPLSSDPRHITPWLNRASLGGLLFPSEPDSAGFRTLPDGGRGIIDEMLAQTPPPPPADAESYLRYLMEPVEEAETPIPEEDRPLVEEVIESAHAFGGTKFIMLSGLPGTGKTRLARMAADRLVEGDESRLKEIQFHESVSYEDFAEGFVPRKDGSGFELRPKVLRTLNERALANPKQLHVLIIEEFTRANTHSVLGELMTYIEHRDRPFQWSISQDPTSIASNLLIIGTMNPRDKSALQLDTAVKRRLHVIAIPPSASALEGMLGALDSAHRDRILDWFRSHLDSLPFGHGLFAGVRDVDSLRKIWRGTMVPLLSDSAGEIPTAFQQAYEEFPFR